MSISSKVAEALVTIGVIVETSDNFSKTPTGSYTSKFSLFILGQRRVARPIICSKRIRDFTKRKNTKVVISGTSIPVVSKSTVTAILG